MQKMLLHLRLAIIVMLALISGEASAQKTAAQLQEMRQRIEADPAVSRLLISSELQTPSLVVIKKQAAYPKESAASLLQQFLMLRAGIDQLLPLPSTKHAGGIEILAYRQYFKGIKVDRSGFKVLVKGGNLQLFNGSWYDLPAHFPTAPALRESRALDAAKQQVGARKYAWEELRERISTTTHAGTRAVLQKELDSCLPKGELVIIKDFNKKGIAVPRLAWKFNIYASEPISRAWIYIDAQDGHTLLIDKIIKHADEEKKPGNPLPASVSTTVQTRYAGAQQIRTRLVSGNDPNSGNLLLSSHPLTEPLFFPGGSTYILSDDTRGNGIETYDLNGAGGLPLSLPAVYGTGKSFTDMDNNWTLSEHKRSMMEDGAAEAENDDIAWDAHWGASVVYDYWLAKHNRLSFDGNDAKIKSFIHYGPAYDNAFWNGSAMTYGDGSGIAAGGFKALTSLDVCGHEIGHGVCDYTAELIYQGESGAMNEAFSDIWAACIEHFAQAGSGATVPANYYRPFYIGEQIGATFNDPLRRMDNPKATNDPDTYGGQFWANPNCASSLANDYCGVHNNSGLLNKWFYLIAAGSRNGLHPASMDPGYYFADSDDEINDLGQAYRVNGLGFDMAENIAFLTECLLTSSATFAEAKEISIELSKSLSGDPCSALVETVTNAWYAVGVGPEFVKPCKIRYGFVAQNGMNISEASSVAGCQGSTVINIPVLLPPNSTASITVTSGSATPGQDYSLANTSLTNTGTTLSQQNILLTVFNDGIVEALEQLQLQATISNLGTNLVNPSLAISFLDDDVVPVVGTGSRLLLSENFTRTDGFSEPQGWTEVLEIRETQGDPLAMGKNQWGIFDNRLTITGREGATNTVLPNGTYNPNSRSQTLVHSPLIDARGLSLVNLRFDYTIQGEVDPQSADPSALDPERLPVFDYMAIAYSFDGVNFIELNSGDFHAFASAQPSSGTFQANLPAGLSNKQFYLAFRWFNDDNAGGPLSVSVDNLELTGAPRIIENTVNSNGRENLPAGQQVYFYSVQDGELLGVVKNNSTKNFNCTNLLVERSGSGSFNLYQGRDGIHKVADKIIRVEPSLAPKASFTVNLYFTEEQIVALEAMTGQGRQSFQVYQVNAASYALAASANTKSYSAVFTAIAGVGGYFTATINDYPSGSFAIGVPVTLFTVQRAASAEESVRGNWKVSAVYPNPGHGSAFMQVYAPRPATIEVSVYNNLGQLVHTQRQQVVAGANRMAMGVATLAKGAYTIRLDAGDGTRFPPQTYLQQ